MTNQTMTLNTTDFTVDTVTGEAFISFRRLSELIGKSVSSIQNSTADSDTSRGIDANLMEKIVRRYAFKGEALAQELYTTIAQAGAKAFIYHEAGFKMKAEQKTPQTFLEAMQIATRALEALEAAKPAIKFHSEMFTTNARCSMNQFAKLLTDSSGVKIGQNKMMEFLRKSGYLMVGRDRNERNRPYQKYMEAGWFEVDYVKTPIGMIHQTFITVLGQTELSEHILAKFS